MVFVWELIEGEIKVIVSSFIILVEVLVYGLICIY